MLPEQDPARIPLAIVGMACRLPGADDLDQYWRLVIEGRTAVAELPPERLDQKLYFDPKVGVRGKTYSKLGAILSNRHFNRAACPISDELASGVDLAHLLMCEVAAGAFRHAGLDPFHLSQRNVGVYIGHAQGSTLGCDYTYGTCIEEAAHFLDEVEEFRQLSPQEQRGILAEFVDCIRARLPQRSPTSPDVGASLVAGTISKAFGLTGPYLAINSACASSLQSILLGARALQLGRIEMAIVGGASDCKSDSLVLFSQAQALSATGSRPFDSEADGLICGEGYAAIVLKRLDRALADGNSILAVVRGLGVASDGRGKSLWAPRKEGQIEAMRRAYRQGVEMSRLQYIEAHATATQLGDATELNTLAEALTGVLPAGCKIPITSVKANIGHSLETAGIAGVIKAVLCIQHGMVPPAVGIRQLNPKIDWDRVPYYVPREATPWPAPADGHPRRAAVNAFGIGGLNMHIVIDQYTEAAPARYFASPPSATAAQSAPHPDREAVAVIGRGCILPGAADVQKFWQLLHSQSDPKCDVPDGRWRTDLFFEPGSARPFRSPSKLGGFVRDFSYDWRRHKVPPKQIAEADPLQFMLLDAADQAMRESGYDQKPFDRKRAGVVVGTEFGGDFAFQLQMGLRLPEMEQELRGVLSRHGEAPRADAIVKKLTATLIKHWPALVDETGSFSTSSLASRISKTWDFMGGAAAIDAGGSSALAALAICVDMLITGDVDLMICAAGQRRLGLPQYESLAINGLLAVGSPRSRFDAQVRGFVPGEGVGVLVLKRLTDARRDGDRVLAVIRGVGAGHGAAATDSVRLALDRSFQISGADPADVAVMEADGEATPSARDAELQAIAAVHSTRPRRRPLILGSVASRIGCLDGAAGMASLLKAILEVEHGEFPGEMGFEHPALIMAAHPQGLTSGALPTKLELTTDDGRRLAGVSTLSRGLAFHAVIEHGVKVPVAAPQAPRQMQTGECELASSAPLQVRPVSTNSKTITPQSTGGWRIIRVGGASSSDIRAKLEAMVPEVSTRFSAADRWAFSANDRCRLAIVADSPISLGKKMKLALDQMDHAQARPVLDQQGISLRDVFASRPQIAFAFAGQGSQYVGMLRELVADDPAAARSVAEIDAIMGNCGFPSFSWLAWDDAAQLGVDPWNTQVALLLADRVLEQALAARGIHPDLVFGHSYGEYAALTAAGVWDLKTALAVTRARVDGIEACCAVRGGMLATAASPEVIERVVREQRLPVYVANYNADDQTVVGGRVDDLQQLAQHLQSQSIRSQLLPVPCPFHTPLMARAIGPLHSALQSASLCAPQIRTISVVTNSDIAGAEEVRGNLVAHMTTPVRYLDLVQRVAAERSTVLVEVGPQQVLTRLHQRILAGRDGDCIASDNPKRAGVEQLLHVQALLECVGALPPTSGSTDRSAPTLTPNQHTTMRHDIIEFDATTRRREKMRAASGKNTSGPESPSSVAPPPPSPVRLPSAETPAAIHSGAAVARQLPPKVSSSARDATSGSSGPLIPPSGPILDAAVVANASASNLPAPELERFLINFVVEQTGYPPEVVELDAELEADLGIDSIKKAQLFGELQEYFDITPTENLTLDDFPTLRHVLNFLQGAQERGEFSSVGTSEANRLEKPSPAIASAPSAVDSPPAHDLERFLINFVVEQTGYPPEVVELDADLEADLGIDSIKKAQLFGELQEYFDITPTENLTLDDFPTLRHVLNFLQGAHENEAPSVGGVSTADVPLLASAPRSGVAQSPFYEAEGVTLAVAQAPTVEPRNGAAPSHGSLPLRVAGAPREIGVAIGQQRAKLIRRAIGRLVDCGGLPDASPQDPSSELSPAQLEELGGLADAAGLPRESLLALGLATLADMGAPQMQFAGASTSETWHGCLAETPLSGGLRGCLSPVVQSRHPSGSIPHLLVTYDGSVGGLCGINACRLAISGGIVPRPGGHERELIAASIVERVLGAAADASSAVAIARSVHGSHPWQLLVSQAAGSQIVRVTYDGRHHDVQFEQSPTCMWGSTGQGTATDWDWRSLERELAVFGSRGGDDLPSLTTASMTGSRSHTLGPDRRQPGQNGTPAPLSVLMDLRRDVLWFRVPGHGPDAVWNSVFLAEYLPDPQAPAAPAPAPLSVESPLEILPEETSEFSHRFALRMIDRDFPAESPRVPTWHGAALVIGNNSAADEMRRRLAASGATIVELAVSDDLDATLNALETLWQAQPIQHLFLMSSREDQPARLRDPANWERRRYQNIVLPYFLCQRWLQLAGDAGTLDRCTLIAATALGGDFGFSGQMHCPDSGALTGLLKSIYIEYLIMRKFQRTMIIKAVDAPSSEPVDSLADNILRELACNTVDYEVAYVGGQRRLQTAILRPARLKPRSGIHRGGVWVVTGGARGITAECALELGRRYGLRLHLIGTSPAPKIDPTWRHLSAAELKELKSTTMLRAQKSGQKPNEAWERLEKAIEIDQSQSTFEAAGVRATYHACDVSNRAELATVLEHVRQIDGPIDGILHGAGIDRASRFERKNRPDVLATLGAKVDGAYHLMELTWSDPIRHFIGFGSVTGRLGGNGQTDYGMASDLLCKLVSWYGAERPDCHAIGFHWHPWDEVGMANRPGSRAMLKNTNAPDLMPKRDGVVQLLRELHAEQREHEVLITNWDYYTRYYQSGPGPGGVVHEGVPPPTLLKSGPLPAAAVSPGVPAATQVEAISPPRPRIAQRFLMTLEDAPLPAGSPTSWKPSGPVLILGDNSAARALASRLQAQGTAVSVLTVADEVSTTLAEFERQFAASPFANIVLMTALDPDAGTFLDRAAWQRRRVRGVDTPYWVVQRWLKLSAAIPGRGGGCLAAVTALGGDFGLAGKVFAPEGGAITGLCKSVYVEGTRKATFQTHIKVIDAPADEPVDRVIDALCRELAADRPELEVSWSAGQRRLIRHVAAPLDADRGRDIALGGAWVVTGGARGITAASMLELGRRYGLKLHLIGKSPVPVDGSPWHDCSPDELKAIKAQIVREAIAAGRSPDEDWFRVRRDREIRESLQKYAAAGVQATYHSCDMADWDRLAQILDRIRRIDGRITGVVHGAGYGKPMRIEMKDVSSYEKTVSGKVDGAVALMALTKNDLVRCFVGFGSISGRFGGNGLSDYAVANDLLAKLLAWHRQSRPDCATCCFHWQTWDEVGMATLSDGVAITKNTLMMDFMPLREGIDHLDGELRAGLPAGEVVITDGFFQRTFYPHEFAAADGPISPAAPSRATGRPLLESVVRGKAGQLTASVRFDPDHDPFLIHHRLRDNPFLPGVIGMEAIAEAASLATGSSTASMRHVEIVNGLAFHGSPIEAHVTVTPTGQNYDCLLSNEHRDRKGRLINPSRVCVRAVVEPHGTRGLQESEFPGEPPLGWMDYRYPDEGLMVHGAPLRCLKQFAAQYDGGWGRIVGPPPGELGGLRGGQGWVLPVAVLDACLVGCGTWVYWQFGGRSEVPHGFDRLVIARHPREGELCTLRFHFRGREDRHSRFDFTLHGDDHRQILAAEGYCTVLIAERTA